MLLYDIEILMFGRSLKRSFNPMCNGGIPGVPEVLSIMFSSINQKVYIAGRKTKYEHNLHLMAIQIKTEQSRIVII